MEQMTSAARLRSGLLLLAVAVAVGVSVAVLLGVLFLLTGIALSHAVG